jgi:hypothetical protein
MSMVHEELKCPRSDRPKTLSRIMVAHRSTAADLEGLETTAGSIHAINILFHAQCLIETTAGEPY